MRNPNRKAAERRAAEQNRNDVMVIINPMGKGVKEYGEWLAKALRADSMPYTKKKLGYMSLYPHIVYVCTERGQHMLGTDVMHNNAQNFGLATKNVYLVAVGAEEPDNAYIQALYEANSMPGLTRDRVFYLPEEADMNAIQPIVQSVLDNGGGQGSSEESEDEE